MKVAHFFDIDVILTHDSRVWIVDKSNPNVPIMKIKQSDFNLIKSGIWMSQGNKLDLNGKIFWLSDDIMNALKVKCKVRYF